LPCHPPPAAICRSWRSMQAWRLTQVRRGADASGC